MDLILSWNTCTLNPLQTFHGVWTRPFDSFCQYGFFRLRFCLLYQEIFTDRNPFRAEIKRSTIWMPLLSDLHNKWPHTNKQKNLLWQYNSNKLLYLWGNPVIRSLSNFVSLGMYSWTWSPLLSITVLSSIVTMPLISQSSLRLEFPGSCFSFYSPQNINISSYSMRIYHYSMISGQQGVHGAGYWEVNDIVWKSGDESPLCASAVLKTAMLTSILQCCCFHWPFLYGDSFL